MLKNIQRRIKYVYYYTRAFTDYRHFRRMRLKTGEGLTRRLYARTIAGVAVLPPDEKQAVFRGKSSIFDTLTDAQVGALACSGRIIPRNR